MQSFDAVGLWFLPDDDATKIGGILRYSVDDGLSLSLAGSFQKSWGLNTAEYAVIHGVVSESPYGKFLSLFRCFATKIQFGIPGTSAETITANYGFAGTGYVENDTTLFDRVSVRFTGLPIWLNRPGLDVRNDNDGIQFRWKRPGALTSTVGDATVSADSGLTIRGDASVGDMSISELPVLSVSGFDGLPHGEIHAKYVWPLFSLLTLAADGPPSIEHYEFSGGAEKFVVNRLAVQAVPPLERPPTSRFEFLFTCADWKDGFDALVRQWFEFVYKHPRFCTAFFSQGYQEHGFLEARLLSLINATECFLTEDSPLDNSTSKRFDESIQVIRNSEALASLPYAFETLPSAAQLSAPTELAQELGRRWTIIRGVLGTEIDDFIHTLYSTVKEITHNAGDRKTAVYGTQIYWLRTRLAAVLKILVMHRIGFDEETIASICQRNPMMSHLQSSRAPWDDRGRCA